MGKFIDDDLVAPDFNKNVHIFEGLRCNLISRSLGVGIEIISITGRRAALANKGNQKTKKLLHVGVQQVRLLLKVTNCGKQTIYSCFE